MKKLNSIWVFMLIGLSISVATIAIHLYIANWFSSSAHRTIHLHQSFTDSGTFIATAFAAIFTGVSIIYYRKALIETITINKVLISQNLKQEFEKEINRLEILLNREVRQQPSVMKTIEFFELLVLSLENDQAFNEIIYKLTNGILIAKSEIDLLDPLVERLDRLNSILTIGIKLNQVEKLLTDINLSTELVQSDKRFIKNRIHNLFLDKYIHLASDLKTSVFKFFNPSHSIYKLNHFSETEFCKQYERIVNELG